jgi:hypothetical protein
MMLDIQKRIKKSDKNRSEAIKDMLESKTRQTHNERVQQLLEKKHRSLRQASNLGLKLAR